MYLEHFNLERKPFDQLPDPDFLFLTQQHDEALSRMQFAIGVNDSFTIITGEVGSGKTTLVRKLLADMADQYRPAFVTHTRLDAVELLQLILVQLGVKPFRMGKTEMLVELQRLVDSEREEGRRVIIVVDEAQNFTIDVLEELRLLTCMDTAKSKSINIILIGQPQLNETLHSPDLDQLTQRCRLRFHLNALSKDDAIQYIRHRLAVAGGKPEEIFDVEALDLINDHTRGIPRLINTLCDTAMIMSQIAGRERVSITSVDEAISELAWEEPIPLQEGSELDQLDIDSSAHITLTKRGQVKSDFWLKMPSYVIGRSDDCSIVIRSKYLSRHHAMLSRDPQGWMIMDLRSTNGIAVNGRDVNFARLTDRDIIGIGEYLIRFSLHKPRKTAVMPAEERTEVITELPDLA